MIDVIECVCILIMTFIMICFACFILYNLVHMDKEIDEDEEWVNNKKYL